MITNASCVHYFGGLPGEIEWWPRNADYHASVEELNKIFGRKMMASGCSRLELEVNKRVSTFLTNNDTDGGKAQEQASVNHETFLQLVIQSCYASASGK